MPNRKRVFGKSSVVGWDPVAEWYTGWVGEGGSQHHQQLAIPAVLDLLQAQKGEKILDIGAGHGVLAPYLSDLGVDYVGVDASPKLLEFARTHHGNRGTFILGDARKLYDLPELHQEEFDAAVFLLSIQDMDPLQAVLESVDWALRPGGHVVILMTHPCFRIPRQSGWGWDEGRKLTFRRVDRYLSPLPVPMKPYPGQQSGVTISFHRPLQAYVNGLVACGICVDRILEIPTYKTETTGPHAKAQNLANQEIPLFLGLRGYKL